MQKSTLGRALLFSSFAAVLVVANQNCGKMNAIGIADLSSQVFVASVPMNKNITQTVAALDSVSEGLTTAQLSELNVISQKIYDFEQKEALALNLFTPSKIKNIEEALSQSSADKDKSFVTITGANSHRPMIVMRAKGLGLISEIVKAKGLLSDRAFNKIYSMGASQLFLANSKGQFVDVSTQRLLNASEVKDYISKTSEIKKKFVDSGASALMVSQWKRAIDVQSGKAVDGGGGEQFSIQSLNEMIVSDNLDLKLLSKKIDREGLAQKLRVQRAELSTQQEKAIESCVLFVCWTSGHDGKMDPIYADKMSGGYAQTATNFGANSYSIGLTRCNLPANVGDPQKQTFFKADGTSETTEVYPTGCGPSSAASLMDFHWRHFGTTYYNKKYNGDSVRYNSSLNFNSPNRFIKNGSIWENLFSTDKAGSNYFVINPKNVNRASLSAQEFEKQIHGDVGKNVISKAMGSCWYRAGTFTWPANYMSGLRETLAAAGSSQQVVGVYNYLGGNIIPFINNTAMLASHLRESVGKDIPAVALYNYGTGSLHYSTVLEYNIRYHIGYTSVMIRPTDQPDRTISLSDPFSLASGVFYITKVGNTEPTTPAVPEPVPEPVPAPQLPPPLQQPPPPVTAPPAEQPPVVAPEPKEPVQPPVSQPTPPVAQPSAPPPVPPPAQQPPPPPLSRVESDYVGSSSKQGEQKIECKYPALINELHIWGADYADGLEGFSVKCTDGTYPTIGEQRGLKNTFFGENGNAKATQLDVDTATYTRIFRSFTVISGLKIYSNKGSGTYGHFRNVKASLHCPSGHFVVGVKAKIGDKVDQVALICRNR